MLDPAQLIKIMKFLYGRQPEIGMRVELLIEPRRSTLVGSDAEEIRLCMPGQRPLFFANVAGALFESPNQMHLFNILSDPPKTQECEFELANCRRPSGAAVRLA